MANFCRVKSIPCIFFKGQSHEFFTFTLFHKNYFVGYPQQNNFAGIFRFKIDSPLFVSSGVIVSPQLCIHRGVRCPQRGKYKNSPVSASPGSHLEFFSKLNTFATPFKWSIIQKQLLLTLLLNDICFLFEKLSLR